jgi:hypothetical protein
MTVLLLLQMLVSHRLLPETPSAGATDHPYYLVRDAGIRIVYRYLDEGEREKPGELKTPPLYVVSVERDETAESSNRKSRRQMASIRK